MPLPISDFLVNLAASFAYDFLKAVARPLRENQFAKDERKALQRVFGRVFLLMLDETAHEITRDLQVHVSDIFHRFITERKVAETLLVAVLSEQQLPVNDLTDLFWELGFDRDTLPVKFEDSMVAFAGSLAEVLSEEAASHGSPLYNKVSLSGIAGIRRILDEERRASDERYDSAIEDYLRALRQYCSRHPYPLLSQLIEGTEKTLDEIYVPPRVQSRQKTSGETPLSTFNVLQGYAGGAKQTSILLLGEAGAGKSTLLRQFAKRAWDNPSEVGLDQRYLPMIVRLQSLALAEGAPIGKRLLGALHKANELVLLQEPPEDFFAVWPRQAGTHWLLLLDGLDEIPADNRAATLTWLQDMIQTVESQGHRVILTSRPSPDPPSELKTLLSIYDLLPFTLEQRREFAQRWLPDGADAFLQEIERVKLTPISDTPLLLTIAVAVYSQDRQIPENRNALYERFIDILLAKAREHGMRGDLGDDLTEVARFGLEHFALVMSEQPGETSAAALKRIAATYVREELGVQGEAIATARGSRFVDVLGNRSGVFVCRGETCEWAHPTIREYLAASALNRQLEAGRGFEHVLKPRLRNEELEEVMVRLAGLTSQPVELVTWMSEQVVGDRDSDIALLVYECFENSGAANDTGAKASVVNALITALGDTQSGLGKRDGVKDALAGLGAPIVEHLITTLQELNGLQRKVAPELKGRDERLDTHSEVGGVIYRGLRKRSGIVEVLGRIADPQAITPLVSSLDDDEHDYYRDDMRRNVERALKIIGEPAVNYLIEVVREPTLPIQHSLRYIDALGFIGLRVGAIPPLLGACIQRGLAESPELFRRSLSAATALRDVSQSRYAIEALSSDERNTVWAGARFLNRVPVTDAYLSLRGTIERYNADEGDRYDRRAVVTSLLGAIIGIDTPEAKETALQAVRKILHGIGGATAYDVIRAVSDSPLPGFHAELLAAVIKWIEEPSRSSDMRHILERLSRVWRPEDIEELVTSARRLAAVGVQIGERFIDASLREVAPGEYDLLRDERVQRTALYSLSKCQDGNLGINLGRLLKPAGWNSSMYIADLLWVAGDTRAEEALLYKLENPCTPHEHVPRSHTARALGTCSTEKGAKAVLDYVAFDPRLPRDLSDEILHPLIIRGAATAGQLVDIINNSQATDFGRQACMVTLALLDPTQFKELFRRYAFSADRATLQEQAVRLLGFTNDQSSEQDLLNLLNTTDNVSVAAEAAESLSRLEVERAVPDIERVLGKFSAREEANGFLLPLAHFRKPSSLQAIRDVVSAKRWFSTPYGVVDAVCVFWPDPWVKEFITERLEKWGGGMDRGEQGKAISALAEHDPAFLLEHVIKLYDEGRLDESARRQLAEESRQIVAKVSEEKFLAVMKRLISDSHLTVRDLAGQALNFIGDELPLKLYNELTGSGGDWERACATYSLGFWGGDESELTAARYSHAQVIRDAADEALLMRQKRSALLWHEGQYQSERGTTRLSSYLVLADHGQEENLWRLWANTNSKHIAHTFLSQLSGAVMKQADERRKEKIKKQQERFGSLYW